MFSRQKEGNLGRLELRNTTKSYHAAELTQEICQGRDGLQRLPLREGGKEKESGSWRHWLFIKGSSAGA